MNKYKTICALLLVLFVILTGLTMFKLKKQKEFQQKLILAHDIRLVLEAMMPDLVQAHVKTIQELPADGRWHDHLVFVERRGMVRYFVQANHLLETIGLQETIVADNIADIRVRRQPQNPGLLEIQIEARKDVPLIFDLKMRMRP